MEKTLISMFSHRKGKLSLRILHTSLDKKDPDAFDAAVHNLTRVLVMVKSTAGHVFGAYIEDRIGTQENLWKVGNDENFLFALGNVTGETIKLIRTSGDNGVSEKI